MMTASLRGTATFAFLSELRFVGVTPHPNASIDASQTCEHWQMKSAAWQADRNKNHAKPDWQFTPANARIKLKRLYPAPMRDSWN